VIGHLSAGVVAVVVVVVRLHHQEDQNNMSSTSKSLSPMAMPTPQDPVVATVSNNNGDDTTAASSTRNESQSSTTSSTCSTSSQSNKTLEGTLLYNRGRSQPTLFKTKILKQTMRMYTTFDMSDRVGADFGSLKCYRFVRLSKKESNLAYSSTRLLKKGDGNRRTSLKAEGIGNWDLSDLESKKILCLEFPPSLPWTVRDVENDATAFIVEVSTHGYSVEDEWDGFGDDATTVPTYGMDASGSSSTRVLDQPETDTDAVTPGEGDDDDEGNEHDDFEDDEDGVFNFCADVEDDVVDSAKEGATKKPNQVRLDLARAASRNQSVVRYSFRCPHKKNEKALWLTAFGTVGRLSTGSNRKKGFFGAATAAALTVTTMQKNSRVRTSAAAERARTSFAMEWRASVSSIPQEEDVLEYRVRPSYAYPHRWMTHMEMMKEMTAPSAMVRDLRLRPEVATRAELGLLRVEVLQCLGLPEFSGNAVTGTVDPNATVYLVCGSHAFSTDVISSCSNPMWLSGVKRACLMPIYHGYARLFAGVFHDDGSKNSSKDTFIGRVAIEVARLKPRCTYDVTLPLRLSTSVYSRRKLGAIRIRLTLSNFDTKQILRSYLPNKRNRFAGQVATTVACGDPKSFRAVALTVHGKNLPGKFSTEAVMAIIREFTFVQKSVVRIVKKFIEDLVVWRYPAMSSFAFFGWMHCVRNSSATLAPVYALGMVVLQLLRNYARCIVDTDLQPMSLGDILAALIAGVFATNAKFMPSELDEGTHDSARRIVSLFQTIGMLKNDEYYVDGADTYTHKEFPFSSLAGYPRFHVEEATEDATTGKPDLGADSDRSAKDGGKDEEFPADMGDDTDDSTRQNKLQIRLSESDQAAYATRLHFQSLLPEQNIDKKKITSDKTLAEELQEVKDKAHKYTMHLFADNQPYMITDTTTPPWGRRQQKNEKDGEEYDVKRDLDKLLGLGLFSQWNPIVSKFTVQIEPLVGVFEVALCAYRSIYNILTWRDPFLSFWFSICCILTIVVFLFFPWRAIFFAVGVVGLGPQNWIMRRIRELMPSSHSKVMRPGRFLRSCQELLQSDKGGNSDDGDTKQLSRRTVADNYSPQPIFRHHAPANKGSAEQNQSIGAQHIRIPYTPLNYHRFYDWPPDPKYAHVLKEMPLHPLNLFASNDEIVTVQELPTPPQTIDPLESTNNDGPEEANNLSGSAQTIAVKTEETSPILSTTSLPTTVTASQPDAISSALSQLQDAETVSRSSIIGNNAPVGKTWSRAMNNFNNNLNKAIAKGGQVKENLEKKAPQRRQVGFDKEGAKYEEVVETKSQPPRAMNMDLPNINWLTGGVGRKENRTSFEVDQSESSDQSDENSSACVGVEGKGDAPGPTNEETTTQPGCVQDKDVTRPEDRSSSPEDTSEPFQHGETMGSRVSGDETQEKSADTAGPTSLSLVETKNDHCYSLPTPVDDTECCGEGELEQEGNGLTLEKGTNSTVDFNPKGAGREKEGGKENNSTIDVDAIIAPENSINAITSISESALLLEELMAVKLELANSRTENDHYRRVLKETEEELDIYRNKCIQYEKPFKKLKKTFTKKK